MSIPYSELAAQASPWYIITFSVYLDDFLQFFTNVCCISFNWLQRSFRRLYRHTVSQMQALQNILLQGKELSSPHVVLFWVNLWEPNSNNVFQVFHLLKSENECGTWLRQHCQVSENPGVLSTLLPVSLLLKQISTDQRISSFSAPNKERKWLSIRLINQPNTYGSLNPKKAEANPSFSKRTLVMQINQTAKGHIEVWQS